MFGLDDNVAGGGGDGVGAAQATVGIAASSMHATIFAAMSAPSNGGGVAGQRSSPTGDGGIDAADQGFFTALQVLAVGVLVWSVFAVAQLVIVRVRWYLVRKRGVQRPPPFVSESIDTYRTRARLLGDLCDPEGVRSVGWCRDPASHFYSAGHAARLLRRRCCDAEIALFDRVAVVDGGGDGSVRSRLVKHIGRVPEKKAIPDAADASFIGLRAIESDRACARDLDILPETVVENDATYRAQDRYWIDPPATGHSSSSTLAQFHVHLDDPNFEDDVAATGSAASDAPRPAVPRAFVYPRHATVPESRPLITQIPADASDLAWDYWFRFRLAPNDVRRVLGIWRTDDGVARAVVYTLGYLHVLDLSESPSSRGVTDTRSHIHHLAALQDAPISESAETAMTEAEAEADAEDIDIDAELDLTALKLALGENRLAGRSVGFQLGRRFVVMASGARLLVLRRQRARYSSGGQRSSPTGGGGGCTNLAFVGFRCTRETYNLAPALDSSAAPALLDSRHQGDDGRGFWTEPVAATRLDASKYAERLVWARPTGPWTGDTRWWVVRTDTSVDGDEDKDDDEKCGGERGGVEIHALREVELGVFGASGIRSTGGGEEKFAVAAGKTRLYRPLAPNPRGRGNIHGFVLGDHGRISRALARETGCVAPVGDIMADYCVATAR
jgi:hypothetical protein